MKTAEEIAEKLSAANATLRAYVYRGVGDGKPFGIPREEARRATDVLDAGLRDLVAERRAARAALEQIKGRHRQGGTFDGKPYCYRCHLLWPCPDYTMSERGLGGS